MTMLLPDLLAKRAELTPHKRAFWEARTGKAASFLELHERAGRFAQLMLDRGVAPGERVAILCRNRIDFFAILFACARAQAVLAPLNWRMPATELSTYVDVAKPKLLIYGSEDRRTAHAFWGVRHSLDIDAIDFERQLASHQIAEARFHLENEPWYLLFTSGTTGAPKAVIQTYGMSFSNYVNLCQALDLRSSDSTLNFLPLFHTAGINLHTLPVLFHGGESVILPQFDADHVFDLLDQRAISLLFGVPAVYLELSRHQRFAATDLSSVRQWGCGGAPLPDELSSVFLKRGARICNGLGMTETGPTLFLATPDAAARKIGTIGRPQLLSSVRLVDASGEVVKDEGAGELQVKGPAVTPGYWENDGATRAAFTSDKWLKTGDLARRDSDGDYFVLGRLKEMFISGGENIYPVEVENVLAAHPDILEAAVVGVADARWGEVGHAFVRLRPEARVGPDALSAFCRERLAAYKIPKQFHFVDDFVRTAAGKIKKHELHGEVPHGQNRGDSNSHAG